MKPQQILSQESRERLSSQVVSSCVVVKTLKTLKDKEGGSHLQIKSIVWSLTQTTSEQWRRSKKEVLFIEDFDTQTSVSKWPADAALDSVKRRFRSDSGFFVPRPSFSKREVHTQTLVVMLVELHVLLLTALYWGSGGRTTTTKSSSTWKNISSHREREDRGDNSFRFFLLYFFLRSESTEKNLSRRRRLLSWKSWTTISTWRWWQRQAACSDVTSHSRCQRGIVLRQLKEGSRGEERSLVGEEVKGATCTDSCSLQEKNIPCSPCSLSYTV